ncbi:uncharacterized protein LOC124925551 [Impatiens glandulifera]|uniref:uncharacterized protein LOC124925551 n=1 Tax=Impatiens glandulifera TaxID=253017 RepID=UPI001FB149A5|nr:uncharacterized protein LOC124925551 [Impatiens glandulifera]
MIEQFINFVIRPPRAQYDPEQYLWEKEFTLAGRHYRRLDIEITNKRGYALQCSHYVPEPFPDDTALPCVVYCHGNSGCRADANEAAVVLLPSNITVFTFDFSGSGLSAGDYVSLGWHEKDDVKAVVSYLRNSKQISFIGLWGRSMGAVTSLLYGAEDPSIAGMVLDSAFSNLFSLMMELVDVYKIRLPKFTVKVGIQYMRRIIQRKAKFDIMDLNCLEVAPKTFIPALFGHANDDKFIKSHHSDLIFNTYAGDKNVIKFDGDHNSSRPQFYYDSVSIFFYNILQPPQISPAISSNIDKYHDFGNMKFGSGIDETLLFEIISGLQTMGADAAASSSSLPPRSVSSSNPKLVADLSEIAAFSSEEIDLMPNENEAKADDPSQTQEKRIGENDESCSYTSSNRESWGICSSLGSNDDHLPSDDTTIPANDNGHKTSPEEPGSIIPNGKKKKGDSSLSFTRKRDKHHDRLDAFKQRFRHWILNRKKRSGKAAANP